MGVAAEVEVEVGSGRDLETVTGVERSSRPNLGPFEPRPCSRMKEYSCRESSGGTTKGSGYVEDSILDMITAVSW